MAAVERAREPEVRTYGNWRKPQSFGIAGLGTIGTAMILVGAIVMILTLVTAGFIAAFVVVAMVAVMAGLLVIRDRHDRTVLQRAGERIGWRRARASGAHLYRSGPLGRTPWGVFQLPGLAAASKLSEGVDAYGRPFAMVHVPSTSHYTVVLSTDPDGASLVDQEQIDSWVAHWGAWLASLGDEPGLVAVSVTVETAPDTGNRLAAEVFSRMDPNAPAVAREMLEEVVQTYPHGSATVKAWVALTFSSAVRAGGRRRDGDEMARELATRIPGLVSRLSATGAGAVQAVGAQKLCEIVRVAYDPPAARLFELAHSSGASPELTWSDVGPTASEAAWDHYCHDGATSMTWSMTTAPRGEVQSSVLTRLLLPRNEIARKRVTLLYRPLDAAVAARIVEADKRKARFRATGSDKPTERMLADVAATEATAREEARGAGLVNFGMLVTATIERGKDRADVEAAIDNLAATARLRLRPVYGSQDSAFAAALPLGLVLPKHLRVPAEIREAL